MYVTVAKRVLCFRQFDLGKGQRASGKGFRRSNSPVQRVVSIVGGYRGKDDIVLGAVEAVTMVDRLAVRGEGEKRVSCWTPGNLGRPRWQGLLDEEQASWHSVDVRLGWILVGGHDDD